MAGVPVRRVPARGIPTIYGCDRWLRGRIAPRRVPARGTPTIHGREGGPLAGILCSNRNSEAIYLRLSPQRSRTRRSKGPKTRLSMATPITMITTITDMTCEASLRSRPVCSRFPRLSVKKSNSPAISERQANVHPCFSPFKIAGMAAGIITCP